MLVQAGIKQVRYSKDSVVVDFYWERFIDGVEPSAAPARPAATPKTERPTPAMRVGPSLQSSTHQMVSSLKSIRTLPFSFPNQSHDYWREFYQSKARTVTV
ncbi:MAG: hypothetical protein IPN19_11950 [Elusimicrobia bacterium]|nr:hypothetical protein [Elusimicrobiota bacterium]